MTDTKDRITPVAFTPAPVLMNLPLARPWRRALAMLSDLTVIALLTGMDDLGLGLFFLVLWFVYKSKLFTYLEKLGTFRVWVIRGGSLLIVILSIVFIYYLIANQAEKDSSSNAEEEVSVSEIIEVGSLIYQLNKCQEEACFKPLISDFIEFELNRGQQLSESELAQTIDSVAQDKALSDSQILVLKQWSYLELNRLVKEQKSQPGTPQIEDDITSLPSDEDEESTPQASKASPLNWLMGFVEDLGLGFGFAAIYFSCFTAWFNGQTFGKMLFNIRVIQLNNSKISLWESFGRYGGYGAGLATGLLGFAQIYWDPNRQAIQDKISATVVIDLGLKHREDIENINAQVSKVSELDAKLTE